MFKDKEKIEIARRRGSFRVKKMAFAPVEINKSKQSYDNKKKNTYKNLKKLFFLYFINSNKSSFDTNYR